MTVPGKVGEDLLLVSSEACVLLDGQELAPRWIFSAARVLRYGVFLREPRSDCRPGALSLSLGCSPGTRPAAGWGDACVLLPKASCPSPGDTVSPLLHWRSRCSPSSPGLSLHAGPAVGRCGQGEDRGVYQFPGISSQRSCASSPALSSCRRPILGYYKPDTLAVVIENGTGIDRQVGCTCFRGPTFVHS